MKVRISQDELWPDYRIVDSKYGHEVEATPDQVARWQKARADFEAARTEMGELWDVVDQGERDQKAREKAEREAQDKARQEEARAAAQRARAEEDARWERINRDGGIVYDADGKPVAQLARGVSGQTFRLITQPTRGQES